MSGPFPGMDPWLESPLFWPGVHSRLIIYIADALQPLLGSRYVAAVEERVYVASVDRSIVPDVSVLRGHSATTPTASAAVADPDEAVLVDVVEEEVHEPYIEILDLETGQQVVTVLELLSPSNKQPGAGRDLYLAKQHEVLHSQAALVEIDLLRGGVHVLAVPEAYARRNKDYDYLVSVSRAHDRRKRFALYPRTIRERLPRVLVPLKEPDSDVRLDLQTTFERLYDSGIYANRIDYSRRCYPPLPERDRAWAEEMVEQWSLTRRG